jgi:tRNA (mo5U34)-methyltransferase
MTEVATIPRKLNIGGGMRNLPGYELWDLGEGHDGADLSAIPDNCLEEIRASHVLEHWGWREIPEVLAEWFRKIKPGGLVKIAVPDFDWMAKAHLSGRLPVVQSYVYGGQTNDRDYHKSLFTEDSLRSALNAAGFVSVQRWAADINDCSALECSLNLMARKPGGTTTENMTLAESVSSLPFWYHRIELPGGVVTPGCCPIMPSAYRIPDRLDGLTVLDIGAWDGYWSFEAIKRGAKKVLAIDDFSDSLGIGTTHPAWETFDLCRDALEIDPNKCTRREMSVYDLTELEEEFDIVFFFGTFYHLKHPLLAMEQIMQVCRKSLYVESAILDDFSAYRGGVGNGYRGDQWLMEFYPGSQYGGNASNWFVPTLRCLVEIVASHGFANATGWKLTDDPKQLPLCRGFVKGDKA